MKSITAKFSKRENELAPISERVIENMENNPDFPDPPPALAELKKALPEFTEALAKALGRDIKMVSIKNDKKAKMRDLLQQLADYVTVKSKGDRTLIVSSGFNVTGTNSSTSNQPPSIEKLEVELGQSGEAITRIKNVTGIKAYVHQYTMEPPGLNTIWVGEGSSDGIHTFQGLTSEKRHWFRVVAIGFNKQRAYSPVVSRVIQ
jgi:hypothetical protein